jgi:phospholipase C
MLPALIAAAAALAFATAPASANRYKHIDHVVVVYEENHSFDNLYGGWEGVDGLGNADAAHTTQVGQSGTAYTCLMQNDLNLASPPLPADCTDSTTGSTFSSHFTNQPFRIDDYIPPTAKTCPAPGVFAQHGVLAPNGLQGGCTEDLVHRYYQEQYQLDGGRQDRYVTGSDAVGLTMGTYDTSALPIYDYLHGKHHPHYVIADRFFQSAFGGSFLNHQWLVAARTPTWPGAPNDGGANDLHSVVDNNGMPTSYPLYTAGAGVKDQQLTASCTPPSGIPTPPGIVCGDYAVNTTQPPYQPYAPGTSPTRQLPPQTAPTIGDRLSAKGVDWAWYSGGWSNASGDVGAPGWTNGTGTTCADTNTANNAAFPYCPNKLFQYHHQPLNYYASFAPGTTERAEHLLDEQSFLADAAASKKQGCKLKQVSFIKPLGAENEHPGYASEHTGSDHLVSLLKSIEGSRCAKSTMVIVTYDEFGGQWDHVPPPGQGDTTPGPHDEWGPGTRIPALVVSPRLRKKFAVDDTSYDTSSIMATIERRFGLPTVATRDGEVADLSGVFGNRFTHAKHGHNNDAHGHHGH